MTVKRIVTDIPAPDPTACAGFYRDLLGLEVAMDMGWIMTFSGGTGPLQISVASQGGSGTPVPHLSIEVDDVDAIHARAVEMGFDITYPLTNEPWGVRRFYVRDPAGTLVNVLSHVSKTAG